MDLLLLDPKVVPGWLHVPFPCVGIYLGQLATEVTSLEDSKDKEALLDRKSQSHCKRL